MEILLFRRSGIIQSLNISVACAVTLYEAFRQKTNAGHYNQQKLDDVRYNELFKEWSFGPAKEE